MLYKPEYVSPQQEKHLLAWIDSCEWTSELKRRVQHYGWKYDYKAKKIRDDMRLNALPEPLYELAQQLHSAGFFAAMPDQVIVNEYCPGQGIARHIDCEPCFGDTVATLSLGSGCVMEFSKTTDKANHPAKASPNEPNRVRVVATRVPVWLLPRSVVTMTGEARYQWCHGIPARKSDEWEGERYLRGRRVSLTFRTVKQKQ